VKSHVKPIVLIGALAGLGLGVAMAVSYSGDRPEDPWFPEWVVPVGGVKATGIGAGLGFIVGAFTRHEIWSAERPAERVTGIGITCPF